MVQLYRRKGADTLVNSQTNSDQSASDVAVLPAGGYVVVWADSSQLGGDPSGFGIKGQRFDASGTKLGGEFLVNSTTSGGQLGPTVAALPSGRFVVTWSDASTTGGDTSEYAVRGQMFEANGIPVGSEFLVNTNTPGSQSTSAVSGLAGGGFAISWSDSQGDASGFGIKAQLFNASGAKVGGEILVNTITNGTQNNSSVIGLASGGFAVAWISTTSVPNVGFVGSTSLQLFDSAGARIGSEIQVNGTSGSGFSRANIAALADGFVVTWMQQDAGGGGTDVRAQRFDLNGAKAGSEFVVHTGLSGYQGVPDATALPGGGFIITWQSGPGEGASAYNVFGQIFDAAGARVGAEFVVNSVDSGDQLSPKVAAMPSGDIVVTWSDSSGIGGDSSGFAVKSQILTLSSAPATDITSSATTLTENAIENVAVATLSAIRALNSLFSYQIVADSTGGAFRIDGDKLVVDDNARLDFETAPQVTVTIRATDLDGQTFDDVIVLDVTDIVHEKRFAASDDILVNVNQTGSQSGSTVVALAGGGFAMLWSNYDPIPGNPNAQQTLLRLYNSAGEPQSGEILIAVNESSSLVTAPLADGGFILAREALNPSTLQFSVKAQRYDSAGNAVGGEMVSTGHPHDSSNPAVVQLDTGGFILAWETHPETRAQRFDSSGIAVGSEFTIRSTFSATPLTLVATPNGGFAASWIAQDGFSGLGTVQFHNSASASVKSLSVALGSEPGSLTLLDLAGGGYMLAWRKLVGSDEFGVTTQAIMGQPIGADGNAIGGPVQLGSYLGQYNGALVSFTAHPDGGFVAIWPMFANVLGGYEGQLFDALGVPVGPQFRDSDASWSGGDVGVLADGSIVVDGTGPDSDEFGVYIRLYRPANEPLDLSADNVLTGDANANVLDGQAGNDQIYGNGGSDDLRGGIGNDRLHVSGVGTVVADGGGDFDHLLVDYGDSATAITMTFPNVDPNGGLTGTIGDGGARRIDYSSINIIQITTGSGNDVLYAGQAGSSASMGGGDDRYWGAGGYETVDGGAGVDGVSAGLGLATTSIVWNLATNSFSGPIGSYTNIEYLLGVVTGSANDTITTSSANLDDTVSLGAGDDTATVVNGYDKVNGEFGNDLLIVDYSAATAQIVTTGFTPGSDSSGLQGSIGDLGTRQVDFNNIDRFDIRTGSGNDIVALGQSDMASNDIVSLGGGNDYVEFGRGIDVGDGGTGVDGLAADLGLATVAVSINLLTNSYSGPAGTSFVNFEYLPGTGVRTGSGNDVVVTGQLVRSDIVALGAGADSMTVYDGLDFVDGQTGDDRLIIDYSAATAAVTTTGGVGGISIGTNNYGIMGQIGDGGTRRVDFDNIEYFDVRTGSGNDNIVLGTPSLTSTDTVSLGGGDDSVDFGRGIDVGDGGAGVDSLAANLGLASVAVSINLVTNSFSGPAGMSFVNFEYFGGTGFQTGQGADSVITGQLDRADTVALGAGNDSVTLYNGQDIVYGGSAGAGAANSGLDTLVLDYGAATAAVHNIGALQTNGAGAFGQIGDDSTRLATFQAIDRFLITTGSGADIIATAAGHDEIRTGGGADSIVAGGGDDLLDGGAGDDSMSGGTGNDVYGVDRAADIVVEYAGEGTDEVRTALATYSLVGLANVENLTAASNVNHDFRGNAGNNVVTGGSGSDLLRLYDGGNDIVLAGAGSDNIFFIGSLTSADIVNGGADVDTLILQGNYAGGLTLSANITEIENISILGGGNTNFGDPGTNLYDYALTTNDANFAAGVQARVNGAALLAGEDFTFDGTAETNASFVVYGGRGKDTLTGGLGNDIFFLAEERFSSGDVVNGGSGYDGMFLRGNYTIDFNAPGYTGLFTSIENLTLTSATDERYARGGGSEFDYNLTLSDAIVGAGGVLTVSGTILLATETMILDGSQETDGFFRLFGGKASDTLKGGSQNDLLHGNLGADTLAGGSGADTFRYDSTAESNTVSLDHILDFTAGTDKIDLSRVDARTTLAGDQAFTWIGSSAFSGTAGQLRAFQQGGSWMLEGDVNGDGLGDLVIQLTLQGPTPLGAGDFLL